jgi:hypothetical protein
VLLGGEDPGDAGTVGGCSRLISTEEILQLADSGGPGDLATNDPSPQLFDFCLQRCHVLPDARFEFLKGHNLFTR